MLWVGHFHARSVARELKPMRIDVIGLAALCALNLFSGADDVAAAAQNLVEGKVTGDGLNLFYRIAGPANGDYALILSGGPGEDIDSMQGIADELGKKYRCIMWEQRGTGRSKLTKYDSSTINLNAYIEDIEALRKHLQIEKFIVAGNSWGMILGLAYAGTYPEAVRAVITLGSGPITYEYLGAFADNQSTRLWPSEIDIRDFWRDPVREAANFDRAK